MKYTRKLISTLLIAVMLFSSFNVVFGATVLSESDIKGTWAENQISTWIDKGFITGYEDGSFKPDNTITRAEFFALINRSFGFTETAAVSFSDVSSSNWAYAEVSKAVQAGYIKGYENGTIGVNNPISRQEVAVIVDRLLNLSNIPSAPALFTDSSSIASWAKASVDAAAAKGILQGYASDNNFKPSKPITRAEAVVTLDRSVAAKATVYRTAGTYGPETGTETINGDVVISVTGVTLQNMIINGNLLFAKDIEEGDSHLKNVAIKGLTRVEGGGVNSIYLNNTIVLALIVDKKKGPVRIVVEGTTSVGEATINSPSTLQETAATGAGFSKVTLSELLPAGSKVTLKGTFDSLTVKGRDIQVDLPEGSIKEVISSLTATGMALTLGTDAKIISLILDAAAKILGTGTIEKVTMSTVAKDGTNIEITVRLLGKTDTDTDTTTNTTTPTEPSTGGTDTTAPILSSVTTGPLSLGDQVWGTSNEAGYLYLVPSTTAKTIIDLDQSVTNLLGKKLAIAANGDAAISTAGLALGTYAVYAVDQSNNISIASQNIIIGKIQLTIDEPAFSLVKPLGEGTSILVSAGTLHGVGAGEDVTVVTQAVYDTLTSAKVRPLTVVYTLTGEDKSKYNAPTNNTNYTLYVQNSVDTGIVMDLITHSKEYDGTTSTAVSAGSRIGTCEGDGICPEDDVTVHASGAYNDTQVGTDKLITVSYTLSGGDAGNYLPPANITVHTGVITAKQLTISAPTLTNSKVYDGTKTAGVIPGTLIGVVSGENVTVNAVATYNNAEIGTHKRVTIVYTLSGTDAGNYKAPASETVSTGEITAR
ncbi:hypothetical protein GCM10008018_49500 [Paenibacillus marchantiophytorum]|uniref:SLH domain-containing protein n=1 Tax=Paenibacillus marchantiophytorum TaxID=1619310 RepID=A0ABQ1F305_9BACL|nr:S-layer homology domain-containing protein [Paenibacillus marchantiophytorum]GFZ97239.1 hypothetical protein GCM10008018_49500 [Paenibacillus marchantiophytorum]